MSDTVTITLERMEAKRALGCLRTYSVPVAIKPTLEKFCAALDAQEVQPQPLQPIDDKVEAFRKKFFERTGERLQRTAVVEGLRAALGGEAVEHRYLSTACHHDLHDRCRRTCKFCRTPCLCTCHAQPEDERESTEEAAGHDGTAQYLKSKLAEQPSSSDEGVREWLQAEIAHLWELAAGERREVDRSVSGSDDERVFHTRATVYEYIAKRLKPLAAQPETTSGGER